MDWEVSTIIEALRECYPLTADDSFVSTYDKWAALYKSMQKTVTAVQVDANQVAVQELLRTFHLGLGRLW
jgi:hypothetical protein